MSQTKQVLTRGGESQIEELPPRQAEEKELDGVKGGIMIIGGAPVQSSLGGPDTRYLVDGSVRL